MHLYILAKNIIHKTVASETLKYSEKKIKWEKD